MLGGAFLHTTVVQSAYLRYGCLQHCVSARRTALLWKFFVCRTILVFDVNILNEALDHCLHDFMNCTAATLIGRLVPMFLTKWTVSVYILIEDIWSVTCLIS